MIPMQQGSPFHSFHGSSKASSYSTPFHFIFFQVIWTQPLVLEKLTAEHKKQHLQVKDRKKTNAFPRQKTCML